ncbi:Uncharacterised protein [Halioglobus japonicus]|nr:Uncharacterised protein [Halioglobus japonicus]
MPHRSNVILKLPIKICFLSIGLCLAAAQVMAAVDPFDEESVNRGAQLYELYCSECHGADTAFQYDDLYDSAEMDTSEDYAELVEMVRGAGVREPAVTVEADWPEWAENPAPEVDADVRADVLGTVTRAIDSHHGEPLESDPFDSWEGDASYRNADEFDPVPGATNLADPTAYFYGISEEEVYESIANGTSSAMPGWEIELGGEEAVWDVVNYIRSLWGEEWRY